MFTTLKKNNGMTLVELLVVVVLTGIVTGVIYNVFISQSRAYTVQTAVAEMQQNLRAGIAFVMSEIRLAGYDPLDTDNAGFLTADTDTIEFTADLNEDGDTDDADDPNEHLIYTHYDSNGDGVIDALGRNDVNTGLGSQLVAENIDALNFVYLDANRTVLTTPVATADLSSIRSIQITLLARTGRRDPEYANSRTYRNQNPDGPEVIYVAPGDNFRRRLLTTEIDCRNLHF
ncbi:MAG: PilW family protein [Deltaproteobacteria bacterium]|nr:MAG: PilW family protein [Deltaproteobacteria bacterium]